MARKRGLSFVRELSRFSGGREEKGKRPSPARVGGKDIPLTDAMKADVRRFLAETRAKHGTLIVRLGYTWSDQAGCEPDDFEILLGHVRDLSRILRDELVFDSKKWAYPGMPDLAEYDGAKMGKFMLDHMGYRFVMRDVREVKGEKVEVEVENVGFGKLLLPYAAEVLGVGEDGQSVTVLAQIDLGLKGGEKRRVVLSFDGTKLLRKVDLFLKVVAAGCPIRFANVGIWNDALKANRIGAFTVSESRALD